MSFELLTSLIVNITIIALVGVVYNNIVSSIKEINKKNDEMSSRIYRFEAWSENIDHEIRDIKDSQLRINTTLNEIIKEIHKVELLVMNKTMVFQNGIIKEIIDEVKHNGKI